MGRSEAKRGGVAVSSGESALCVEGTAAAISEVRALVPISVEIRSDRKPTRREALGGGLPLHRLEVLGGIVIILREISDHAF
jgi:hypothetical protein